MTEQEKNIVIEMQQKFIDDLKGEMKEHRDKISEIIANCAGRGKAAEINQDSVKDHEKRILSIEKFEAKVVGMTIAGSAIFSALWAWLIKSI